MSDYYKYYEDTAKRHAQISKVHADNSKKWYDRAKRFEKYFAISLVAFVVTNLFWCWAIFYL